MHGAEHRRKSAEFCETTGIERHSCSTPAPFADTLPCPEGNFRHNAGWSSPVAREAHNLEVAGSNPVPATFDEVEKALCCWFASETGLFSWMTDTAAAFVRRLIDVPLERTLPRPCSRLGEAMSRPSRMCGRGWSLFRRNPGRVPGGMNEGDGLDETSAVMTCQRASIRKGRLGNARPGLPSLHLVQPPATLPQVRPVASPGGVALLPPDG